MLATLLHQDNLILTICWQYKEFFRLRLVSAIRNAQNYIFTPIQGISRVRFCLQGEGAHFAFCQRLCHNLGGTNGQFVFLVTAKNILRNANKIEYKIYYNA